MGIFDKIFETKYCGICNGSAGVLGNKKLRDGYCCKNCEAWLSPYYKLNKAATVADINYQIDCRKKNVERLRQFNATRTIGLTTKLLLDEINGQFVITTSKNFRDKNTDVIDCSQVTNCTVDIIESSEEIQYIDSNDNTKSFNPPCYAYSYDFFVEIDVNVPYIDTIRFKINNTPIDNGQETLIKMEGGLLNRFADALLPAKSYKGMTSNAQEVRASAQYQKCEQIANDMRSSLMSSRSVVRTKIPDVVKVECPWCGSKMIPTEHGRCINCGGGLDG